MHTHIEKKLCFLFSQSLPALSSLSGPSSKFRHIQGNVQHRDTHITNLRGINLTTPGECDGFCSSSRHVAVPLAIAGGQIAVFEVLTGLLLSFRNPTADRLNENRYINTNKV